MTSSPACVVRLTDDPSGPALQGRTTFVRHSRTPVYAFLGVPYAQPPVGKRRFRPPESLELWTGTKDATDFGAACPQDLQRMRRTHAMLPRLPSRHSEDCLYLNIWTPTISRETRPKLPVLVWFHGGAFVQGFGDLYDGSPMATFENVIVVSINYRLGVFGFFRTGGAPGDFKGNQGLQDQLESLRWVQNYIERFGGDPHNVTVFGQSAGGISISLLLTSAQSRGLFRRCIIQSGPALYGNAVWRSQGAEKFFHKRLAAMGYKGSNPQDLVQFVSTKNTEDFVRAFGDWYVPCVVDGQSVTRQPSDSFRRGLFAHVDCLMGFNSSEGISYTPTQIPDRPEATKAIRATVTENFYRGRNKAVSEIVARLAVDHYVGRWPLHGGSAGEDMTPAVCEFRGDANFVGPSLQQAQLHSDKARTYVYQFEHRPLYSPHPDWVGADHSNEVPYVMGFPFREDIPDVWQDPDRELSRRIMHYWANFARTGNPNGDAGVIWNQFDRERPWILSIRNPNDCLQDANVLLGERMTLWTETIPSAEQQAEGGNRSKI